MLTRRRAMMLSEVLILAAAVGAGLMVASLGMARVRRELKHRQVWQMLESLDEAVEAYHAATDEWPGCDVWGERGAEIGGEAGRGGLEQACCGQILAAMAGVPEAHERLERIADILWCELPASEAAPAVGRTLQDAWGRRLRCLTAGHPAEQARQAVLVHGGRPIFISAGADGRFGLKDIVAASDNLRSDETEIEEKEE